MRIASVTGTKPSLSAYTQRLAFAGSFAAQITENDLVVTSVTIILLISGIPAHNTAGKITKDKYVRTVIRIQLLQFIFPPLT